MIAGLFLRMSQHSEHLGQYVIELEATGDIGRDEEMIGRRNRLPLGKRGKRGAEPQNGIFFRFRLISSERHAFAKARHRLIEEPQSRKRNRLTAEENPEAVGGQTGPAISGQRETREGSSRVVHRELQDDSREEMGLS